MDSPRPGRSGGVARRSCLCEAYQKVSATWRILGDQATSPELIALRGQALARARVADSERFPVASAVSLEVGCGSSRCRDDWAYSPDFVDNVSEAATRRDW